MNRLTTIGCVFGLVVGSITYYIIKNLPKTVKTGSIDNNQLPSLVEHVQSSNETGGIWIDIDSRYGKTLPIPKMAVPFCETCNGGDLNSCGCYMAAINLKQNNQSVLANWLFEHYMWNKETRTWDPLEG